jgi:hypothetical protein
MRAMTFAPVSFAIPDLPCFFSWHSREMRQVSASGA